MTMHGGRTPYDETEALTGPARIVFGKVGDGTGGTVAVPTSPWDIVPAERDVNGEYPLVGSWQDFGLAHDAPQYTHGGTSAGLTYQQPTGVLFEEVSEVNRTIEVQIGAFAKRTIQIIENTLDSLVSTVAAAAHKSAFDKVQMGLYTDLGIWRIAMIMFRPSGAGVVTESVAGAPTRPPAVALILPQAQVGVNDKSFTASKGNPAGVAVQFLAQIEPTAPAGGEHGFWAVEQPGVISAV